MFLRPVWEFWKNGKFGRWGKKYIYIQHWDGNNTDIVVVMRLQLVLCTLYYVLCTSGCSQELLDDDGVLHMMLMNSWPFLMSCSNSCWCCIMCNFFYMKQSPKKNPCLELKKSWNSRQCLLFFYYTKQWVWVVGGAPYKLYMFSGQSIRSQLECW